MRAIIHAAIILLLASAFAAAQDRHRFDLHAGSSYEHSGGFTGDQFVSAIGSLGTATATGVRRSHNMNGFAGSAAWNFSRWLGAQFEMTWHRGSSQTGTLPGGAYRSSNNVTILIIPDEGGVVSRPSDLSFMGGLQIKDSSTAAKWKPFAHILAGRQQDRTTWPDLDQQRADIALAGSRTVSIDAPAFEVGGGVDVRVSKRIDLRIFQFDYVHVSERTKILVAEGQQVNSGVTSFSGGPIVTSLQSVSTNNGRGNMFRIGAGIVFH
jgi:opacity protein-like surface antigen